MGAGLVVKAGRAAILGSVAIAAVLACAVVPAAAGAEKRSDRYIVVLRDSVKWPGKVAKAHAHTYGVERATQVYRHALNGYAAAIPESDLAALRRDDRVRFVAPDRWVTAAKKASPVPPPPCLLTGCLPTGVDRIDGELSSAVSGDGSGQVNVDIAILDGGIDASHPDLNVAGANDCAGKKKADTLHGTFVAGVAAARDDGAGVVGVAPGGRLWDVRVLSRHGDAGRGRVSEFICGIDFVTGTRTDANPANDIEVANMSLGGPGMDDPSCGAAPANDPEHVAICDSVSSGVTYVVSAGNDSVDFRDFVPAAYDEILTATAMADYDGLPGGSASGCLLPAPDDPPDDSPATFSNFATLAADQAHTIAAPGVCILSDSPPGTGRFDEYAVGDGTSFAAPHVAGAIALCIASGPCAGLTPAQIRQKIVADATAYNTTNPGYGFAGDPLHSPDPNRYYGFLIRAAGY